MRDGQYRTNHLLHIILVILTSGLWLIPYAAVTAANARGRRRLTAPNHCEGATSS